MNIFILLLGKLIPLYLIIVLGFLAGKFLKVSKESLASLLIYIITPVVVFYGVTTAKLSSDLFLVPLSFFSAASVICLLFYAIGKRFFEGSEKNLLAFIGAAGNTGYFGLPVALALFGPDALATVVLCILGVVLFENSLGFFITARGHHSPKEALFKLLRLPSLYAFLLGLIFSVAHINFQENFLSFAEMFKGAYSILGMMIVGLGLASIDKWVFDWKFNAFAVLGKFLIWPIMGLLMITIFGFGAETGKVVLLLSSVPVAANSVAYAAELNVHPQKAAVAVFLSTLIAAIYIPFVVKFFI